MSEELAIEQFMGTDESADELTPFAVAWRRWTVQMFNRPREEWPQVRPIQHFVAAWDYQEERITALTAERTELRALLEEFVDSCGEEPCRFDHHGFCQEHMSSPPCLVAEARKMLGRDG